MSPKVTRSGAPDDKSPSVASMRTTEAAEAASVDDSAFILVIDSPRPLDRSSSRREQSEEDSDSISVEEFALVPVYDGSSPPEG